MVDIEDLRFTNEQILRMALAEYIREKKLSKEKLSKDLLPMPGTDIYYFNQEWLKYERWGNIGKKPINLLKYTSLEGKEIIMEVQTSELEPIHTKLHRELKEPGEWAEVIGKENAKIIMRALNKNNPF